MSRQEVARTHRADRDVVLSCRDLSVSFSMDRGTSRVLDDVDVDIRRGEILGVVGESGSGKSMFASSLLHAVVDPGRTDGSITYYPSDGDPVDVLDLGKGPLRNLRWEDISMVFQGAMNSFNPTMSFREHFVETLESHDYDVGEGLERAEQLLADLLEISRFDATAVTPDIENSDLNGVVGRAIASIEPLANSKQVDIKINIPSGGVDVELDPKRIERLLRNLLANAVEHGCEGVTVRVDDLTEGFYIADDGVGIPEGEREDIFESGYSTAEEGTGFGLRITKQIVDAHGWEIRITETDNSGAQFEITEVDTVE